MREVQMTSFSIDCSPHLKMSSSNCDNISLKLKKDCNYLNSSNTQNIMSGFDVGDNVSVWGGGKQGTVGEVCGVSGDGVSTLAVYFPEDKRSEWMDCRIHQVIKISKQLGIGELGTSECVREVQASTVLDRNRGADKLTDGDDETCWQTCIGSQPPHWVRAWIRQNVAVRHLSVRVGGGNIFHLPRVVELWAGCASCRAAAAAAADLQYMEVTVANTINVGCAAAKDMKLLNTINVGKEKNDGKHWLDLLNDETNVTQEQRRCDIWEVRVTQVHGKSLGSTSHDNGGLYGSDMYGTRQVPTDQQCCLMWELRVTGDAVGHVPRPLPLSPPPPTSENTVHELSETLKTFQDESAKEIQENFTRSFKTLDEVLNNEKAMESRLASIEKTIVEFVYKVSEMSGAEDLKQACSNLLQYNVTADNYVKLYHMAQNLSSEVVQTNVEKFVLHNLKDCLKSPSVIHLSLESFLYLFSTDNLCNLDSGDEVVLYEAIIRWVKAESIDEEIKARCEERLPYIGTLINSLVKFANIDKEFLMNEVENEHVISSNEELVNEIYKFLPGRRRMARR